MMTLFTYIVLTIKPSTFVSVTLQSVVRRTEDTRTYSWSCKQLPALTLEVRPEFEIQSQRWQAPLLHLHHWGH